MFRLNESNKKKQTLELTKEKLALLQLEESKLKSILDKATFKQGKLKEEWKKLQLQLEQKQIVKQAYESKQHIARKEEELKQASEEESSHYIKVQTIRTEVNKLEKNESMLKERLTSLWEKTEHYYQSSANITTKLDWLLAKVERELSNMNEQLEHEKVKQLALELSKRLQEGKPCPVCGSTHHEPPNLEDEIKVSKVELEQLAQLRLQIQQEYKQNITIKVKFEQLAYNLFELLQQPNATIELTIDDELFLWERSYSTEKNGLIFFHRLFDKVSSEQRALRQDILQISKEIEVLKSRYYTELANKNHLEKLLETSNLDWENWSERLIQVQKEINVLKDQWNVDFPYILFSSVEDEMKTINSLQEEINKLHQRIIKSVEFIGKKREELMGTTRKIQNKS